MGDKTKIEWTDATWNPVRARSTVGDRLTGWHCEHVSDGCRHCYAELWSRRTGGDHWGVGVQRRKIKGAVATLHRLDNGYSWWAADHAIAGINATPRRRVFIQSMSDLFDLEVPPEWFREAWETIEACDRLSITNDDGWSFYVPADSPVEPAVGMSCRMYGRGIGAPVRGLFLAGERVYYRTADEDRDYHDVQISGPMLRAILEGRKSQTRRVLKPQPWCNKVGQWQWERRVGQQIAFHPGLSRKHYVTADIPAGLPYAIGDRLWVRERWRAGRGYDGASIKDMPPQSRVWHDADESIDNADAIGKVARALIFMPRWASRLTLIVTDVRVQRVAEISEEDARAEGVTYRCPKCGYTLTDAAIHMDHAICVNKRGGPNMPRASDLFQDLWDSTKRPGCAWSDNPWIVAITFEPRQTNIDRMPS